MKKRSENERLDESVWGRADPARVERRARDLESMPSNKLAFRVAEQEAEIDQLLHGLDYMLRTLKRQGDAIDSVKVTLAKLRGMKETVFELADIAVAAQQAVPKAFEDGLAAARKKASERGRLAAEALHNRPDGSREKAERLRALWQSGKYSSRTQCISQEHDALGMSFDAGKRALRNIPKSA